MIRLTPIQEQILHAMGRGVPRSEIAAIHGITLRAVNGHIFRAVHSWGAASTEQLVHEWTKTLPKERESLADTRRSLSHKGTIHANGGDPHVYITLGYYSDGRLGEVFVNVGKQGSTLRGLLDAWSRMVSVALQWGVPASDIVKKFKGVAFEPSGPVSDKQIGSCSSIIDYVVRWIEMNEREPNG